MANKDDNVEMVEQKPLEVQQNYWFNQQDLKNILGVMIDGVFLSNL